MTTGENPLLIGASSLVEALKSWRIWYMLGLNEVVHRYRRSTLGPFWLTLSMGIQALVMGVLFGYLFKHPLDRFLPFLCISLVLWNFLSTTVMEGASSLIGASTLIMQVKRPLLVHPLQTIWRNLIIVGHTSVIFFVVALIYGLYPGAVWALAPIGLVLFLANISWVAILVSVLSARFRDVPMIVQNGFTVLFWLTPVLYMPEQMGGTIAKIVVFNPLFHIIQVLRGPLLLQIPSIENYAVATACALLGWLMTLSLFGRVRARIPFWL